MYEKRVVWKFTVHWTVLKFWAQTKKPQNKQDSKIAYYINGSWYFKKTNLFSSSEEEGIGSVHFDIKILNMMLPTKFVRILTPRCLTLIWSSQQDIIFNLICVFKSPSNFSFLYLKITISVIQTEWNFLHLLVEFFNRHN